MSGRTSITATEQMAVNVAHEAVDADQHLSNTVDTAVLSLSAAGLLASPEQALADHLAGLTRGLAHIRARSREVTTPADLTALVDELLAEPDAVTVYQARYETAGFHHGTYWTRAAARSHCEELLRREIKAVRMRWVADGDDPDRPDPDSPEDLLIVDEQGERESGYVVVPVEIAGLYDPDAEE